MFHPLASKLAQYRVVQKKEPVSAGRVKLFFFLLCSLAFNFGHKELFSSFA
jgi:hypothetical protein